MTSSIDLTTVAAVQAHLGLQAGQDAALLQTLVTAASAFIASYCSRKFPTATYNALFNGLDGTAVVVDQWPITAVGSVVVDGVSIPSAQGTGTASGYLFDEDTIYLRGYAFTRGVQNVAISFTAGYATIPEDVAQACVDIVAAKYQRRRDGHVSGKSINGENINFVLSDVPPNARVALNQHRRVV